MSGSTVLAVGGVTVTATGAFTGALVADIQALINAASVAGNLDVEVAVPGQPLPPPSTTPGALHVLVLPPGETGALQIPAGYDVVVNGAGNAAAISGGDPSTIVVGDLIYSGGAGTVVAAGGAEGSSVADITPNAVMSFDSGNNLVFGVASAQSFRFDAGLNTLVATGLGDVVSVDGSASVIGYLNAGGSVMQNSAQASETMVAGSTVQSFFNIEAGNAIIWGSPGGESVFAGTGSVEFLNGSGISTMTASTGADTVFATGGVDYQGGTGKSLFIGGSGFSTVMASSNEVAYGGTGGEQIILSQGDTLLFVGGAGSDTIMGADSVAPTIWGNNGNNLTVISSAPGALYVLYGNDTMNLASAAGSAHIVALNGGPFEGNDSLTMASAGNDSLVMVSGSVFGLSTGDHTVTVMNWQSSDVMDLSIGYTSADAAGAQAALAGGASSFTLTDGTTVQFMGNKPTNIVHI
jgi:hypothetical protein